MPCHLEPQQLPPAVARTRNANRRSKVSVVNHAHVNGSDRLSSLSSCSVTYADDLAILCKKGKADEALQQLRKIMSKLKLTVNDEKTRICKVPEEEFDFPGRRAAADPMPPFSVHRRANSSRDVCVTLLDLGVRGPPAQNNLLQFGVARFGVGHVTSAQNA